MAGGAKRKWLKPLSRRQADALLADEELRADCARRGVDLSLLVDNLLVPAAERLRRNRAAARSAAVVWQAGRKAGLH